VKKSGGRVLAQMPDLMEQSKMMEWAGIGFGSDRSYILYKSLKVSIK
jgi:hypothetical protein